jgi:hypothetical protein
MRYGEVALPLAVNGFHPIPLHPATKRPAEPGWTTRNLVPWPPDELRQVAEDHYDHACGIAVHDELLVTDLDVRDPEIAAEVKAIEAECLGPTGFVRVGLPPKEVRFRRQAVPGSLRSRKLHPVELFAGSGQVAVFGWHAEACKPYSWPGRCILEATVAELPPVRLDQVEHLLARLGPLVAEVRRRQPGQVGAAGHELHVRVAREMRVASFENAAGRLLRHVVAGERHDLLHLLAAHAVARGVGLDRLLRAVGRHLERLGGENALAEAERLYAWAADIQQARRAARGSRGSIDLIVPAAGPERRVRRRSYFT